MFEFINLVVEKKTFVAFSANIIEIGNLFKFGLEFNNKR